MDISMERRGHQRSPSRWKSSAQQVEGTSGLGLWILRKPSGQAQKWRRISHHWQKEKATNLQQEGGDRGGTSPGHDSAVSFWFSHSDCSQQIPQHLQSLGFSSPSSRLYLGSHRWLTSQWITENLLTEFSMPFFPTWTLKWLSKMLWNSLCVLWNQAVNEWMESWQYIFLCHSDGKSKCLPTRYPQRRSQTKLGSNKVSSPLAQRAFLPPFSQPKITLRHRISELDKSGRYFIGGLGWSREKGHST